MFLFLDNNDDNIIIINPINYFLEMTRGAMRAGISGFYVILIFSFSHFLMEEEEKLKVQI